MLHARSMLAAAILLSSTAGALATPAAAQGRWNWDGGPGPGYRLEGPGAPLLLPELRETRRGRAFVMRNFDFDRNGFIDRREAEAANRAFIDTAGAGHGRFDWDRRARVDAGRGGWDRQGMHNYHFRQGRYGATFTLSDVLFETASAALRPQAETQLQPLADYLDANRRVRLRIDGFTDAVGSTASNLNLSRNRAQAVADALAGMGVDPARFQIEGHGKATPVATNDTAAGRQLNRRVEVALLGQRADSFN